MLFKNSLLWLNETFVKGLSQASYQMNFVQNSIFAESPTPLPQLVDSVVLEVGGEEYVIKIANGSSFVLDKPFKSASGLYTVWFKTITTWQDPIATAQPNGNIEEMLLGKDENLGSYVGITPVGVNYELNTQFSLQNGFTVVALYSENYNYTNAASQLMMLEGDGGFCSLNTYLTNNAPSISYVNAQNGMDVKYLTQTNYSHFRLGVWGIKNVGTQDTTFILGENGWGVDTYVDSAMGIDTITKIKVAPSYDGKIVELVALNSLDINQIHQLEGYLAWKHNLLDLLPPNHLYKTKRPLVL